MSYRERDEFRHPNMDRVLYKSVRVSIKKYVAGRKQQSTSGPLWFVFKINNFPRNMARPHTIYPLFYL